MMNGPGKYDDLCTYAREASDADSVVLIVLGGKHGHGFSVQARTSSRAEGERITRKLAALLRDVADRLERLSPQ